MRRPTWNSDTGTVTGHAAVFHHFVQPPCLAKKSGSSLARLAAPLLGIAVLLASLPTRRWPNHSQLLGTVTAVDAESRTGRSLPKKAPRLANSASTSITVDYPENGSIFPPEITPPTFIWRDADTSAKTWRIDITFADGTKPIHTNSHGEPIRIGEIDPRCVSDSNKLPSLTPEQAASHT